MAKYLEYDVSTGKILSELKSDIAPVDGGGVAYLEIGEDFSLDVTNSIVKDGRVRKAYETLEEKAERKRLQAELAAKSRSRIREIVLSFNYAMLSDDMEEVAKLKAEFNTLKSFL